MRRAAASVSRGDEPEVAGRLCLTNISLNRTTAPQIPAGGMCCQLDMNRHIQLLQVKYKLYTASHDRIYLSYISDISVPCAVPSPSLMLFSRLPAISLYLKNKYRYTESGRTKQSICYQLISCTSSDIHMLMMWSNLGRFVLRN